MMNDASQIHPPAPEINVENNSTLYQCVSKFTLGKMEKSTR